MTATAYERDYAMAHAEPESFWLGAARSIDWSRFPSRAADPQSDGMWTWFPDGELNSCFNAVDRHVLSGRGTQTALVWDSAMTGRLQRFSYDDLLDSVARTAGMLAKAGVHKGDRVIIYMPMIPEAVFAMLACARIGAVHSVVFGGFAAQELAKRIADAEPTVILTASCGLEPGKLVAYKPLVDEALVIATHDVAHVILFQRPEHQAELRAPRDLDWTATLIDAGPVDCVCLRAVDPLYILYTSGTTGIPKGVVHDNGGHAVSVAWSMANIYGARPGAPVGAGSDIGWAVGHSYIVYGPLIHGCTTILYEGKPVGTPAAAAFWRVIRDHGVDIFFTAPTAIRAIKREDPGGHVVAASGVGNLRALFLAGERADPDTLAWAETMLGVPVIDHWWQTELGWPAIATCMGLGEREVRHGSAGRPVPGYAFAVLDERHQPADVGETGDLCIALPLPPGCLPTLWRRHRHFQEAYLETHPGFYTTGDAGCIDEKGRVHILSRTDDIINVAGHRLSTGGIEQILSAHPDVAECAVVGATDALKGMVPVGFVVLKAGADRPAAVIATDLIRQVRTDLGPVAAYRRTHIVAQLPKTRSGKILRAVMRAMVDGRAFDMPPTIDNPEALEVIRAALLSDASNK